MTWTPARRERSHADRARRTIHLYDARLMNGPEAGTSERLLGGAIRRMCYHDGMSDGMLHRTQVQLTRAQVTTLKTLAARRGVSMAAVIRDVVDDLAERQAVSGQERRRQRALEAVGRFQSGRRDVSRRHDAHLAEAYGR
jgi:hypothetical protein